jgi:NAD(P)-dependent dehydrogenase (short-subunit alcohol dehydrogenase family)
LVGILIKIVHTNSIYPAIDPRLAYESQAYKGKTVLITGASRGIGAETALQYAKCGASIALIARRKETLQSVKSEILQTVPKADIRLFVADVSDKEAMKQAVDGVANAFGRLDIVIANAANAESPRECNLSSYCALVYLILPRSPIKH